MIRGSTGRLLTLVLAPLLVVAVTAIVMLPRSSSDKVEVNADGPAVTIESPQSNSHFNRNTIQIVARISDPDGLATAELRVQDKRVATSSLSGSSEELTSFNWEATQVGEYQVAVRARDLNGSWGQADEITITIEPDSVDLPPPPTTILSNVGVVDTTPTTLPGTDPTATPGNQVAGGETSSTLLPPLFPSRTTPPYTPGTIGSPGTPGSTGTTGTTQPTGTTASTTPASEPVTTPAPTLPVDAASHHHPALHRRYADDHLAAERRHRGAARPDHHLDAGGPMRTAGDRGTGRCSCAWPVWKRLRPAGAGRYGPASPSTALLAHTHSHRSSLRALSSASQCSRMTSRRRPASTGRRHGPSKPARPAASCRRRPPRRRRPRPPPSRRPRSRPRRTRRPPSRRRPTRRPASPDSCWRTPP